MISFFQVPLNFLNRGIRKWMRSSREYREIPFAWTEKKETGWSLSRVFEMYSSFVASASYHYRGGDGLSEILEKGFKGILKRSLDLAQEKGASYILLAFSEDPTKREPTKAPSSFGEWCFGEVVSSLPKELHPSRYVEVRHWRSQKSLEGLKYFGEALDRMALALPESMEMLNHTIVKVGTKKSITNFLTMPPKEMNQFAQLMPRLSSEKFNFIGKDDEVFNINRQEHVSLITPQMSSLFSFISGCPLNLVSGDGSVSGGDQEGFLKEIRSIQETLVAPLINELLEKIGRSSQWSFSCFQSEKERQEALKTQVFLEEKSLENLKKIQEMQSSHKENLESAGLDSSLEESFSLGEKKLKDLYELQLKKCLKIFETK